MDADFDRDGDVDTTDTNKVQASNYKAALLPGAISQSQIPGGVNNIFGFCGYVFGGESFIYTVRHRHYDPGSARWLQRDPAGYADSMNLYEYDAGAPLSTVDPFGLSCGGGGFPLPVSRAQVDDAARGAYKRIHEPGPHDRPGKGLVFGFLAAGDPRAASWRWLDGRKRTEPTEWGSGWDWNAFWGEAWEQVKEHKTDIILTAVPGGALLKAARVAGKAGRCFWVVVCFSAGTEVWTAEGVQPIETIEPGAWVWSCDERSGIVSLHQVLETSTSPHQPVFELDVQHADGSCETISGTAEHPLYVKGKGWVALKDLDCGEGLLDLHDSDKAMPVQTLLVLDVRETNRLETVYNLVVSGAHTYFVGDGGVLVHNKCGGETVYTAYGRLRHGLWKPGPGFEKFVGLPSGRVADAVDLERRIVKELKPMNPRAAREGWRQLNKYAKELEQMHPGEPFKKELEFYWSPLE